MPEKNLQLEGDSPDALWADRGARETILGRVAASSGQGTRADWEAGIGRVLSELFEGYDVPMPLVQKAAYLIAAMSRVGATTVIGASHALRMIDPSISEEYSLEAVRRAVQGTLGSNEAGL